jgi:hypothetical protein
MSMALVMGRRRGEAWRAFKYFGRD